MKAVIFREPGGPERLEYTDFPDPVPGPGEALIRVRACALNHLDLWIRGGSPPTGPNCPTSAGVTPLAL